MDIIIENARFRLVVGEDCVTKSLVHKKTGEELLYPGENIALFAAIQERPFQNEIKLAHPNKKTAFQGNRLRREGDKLYIGFELVPYSAVVSIKLTDSYLAFKLEGFECDKKIYGGATMDLPPVTEFRLFQLPIKNRKYFGEWLNVSWDEDNLVNVLADSPYARIDAEKRNGYRLMTADAVKGIKLKGCGAALIVCDGDSFLDHMAEFEEDFDLPRGADGRRNEYMNRSCYWASNVTPETVDEHIKYAKMAGTRMMLLYYPAICDEARFYKSTGNYDLRPEYNGIEGVTEMLDKIKAAGITPGFHVLHTFIGIESRYVTPKADHRLCLLQNFTLAKPLGETDDVIYVEENPEDMPMCEECRILKFGTELISYEEYTTERPYCFKGCKRGALGTDVCSHPIGLIGGVLYITEAGGTAVYIDQNTSLQDEIAEKIACIYNAGFEFVYYDGAEGTQAPHDFHISNAEYKVYKRLKNPPVYCEGAAKSHFCWHFLTGGNAFDIFKPSIFKEKINQFPVEEAPRMREDFTRVNFGWFGYWVPDKCQKDENGESVWAPDRGGDIERELGTQPDIYEFGTSRAAAWDCPVTMQFVIDKFKAHPRTADNLEVIRRWEEVRAQKWLTAEQKLALRSHDVEHILLINENKEYELCEYSRVEAPEDVRAFIFERNGESFAVYWHECGEGKLKIKLSAKDIEVRKELYEDNLAIETDGDFSVLPADGRRYIKTKLPKEALIEAFKEASLF